MKLDYEAQEKYARPRFPWLAAIILAIIILAWLAVAIFLRLIDA